jgi:hypothetical protein
MYVCNVSIICHYVYDLFFTSAPVQSNGDHQNYLSTLQYLIYNNGLKGGHEILDIDKGIFSSVDLKLLCGEKSDNRVRENKIVVYVCKYVCMYIRM